MIYNSNSHSYFDIQIFDTVLTGLHKFQFHILYRPMSSYHK